MSQTESMGKRSWPASVAAQGTPVTDANQPGHVESVDGSDATVAEPGPAQVQATAVRGKRNE